MPPNPPSNSRLPRLAVWSGYGTAILVSIYSWFCVTLRGYFKDATLFIGRFEWLYVILNLVGNSFHCPSRTPSDRTCKLGITFDDESKDFYVE